MPIKVIFTNQDKYRKEFLQGILRRLIFWAYFVGVLGLLFAWFKYGPENSFQAGVLFTAGFMSIAVGIFILPLTLKEFKKQEDKSTGQEDKVLIRFYEDDVEIHQGNSHLRVDYVHLERIFTTKSLYVFQLGKNSGFYFPKEALKDQDQKEFQALLEGPFHHLPRKPRGFFSNK